MPCSSLTRHAGESVSRCVTRTALARSFSAFCIRSSSALYSSATGRLFLRRLVAELAEVEPAFGHRLQRLAFELGEHRHDPLVDAVVHQQHFDAELPEDLQVRAVPGRREAVGGDVVDRVLAVLHPADVVGQRHVLLFAVLLRRREAQQLRNPVAVGRILGRAFLEHAAELVPERRELLRVVARPDPRAGRARA